MILIVDSGSQKTPDILECVEKSGFKGKVCELEHLSDIELSEMKAFEKVIISGAPILLSQIEDPSKYIQIAQNLINLDIPILGICFGHQIIGMAHGAVCEMGEEDRAGQTIKQECEDPIFDGLNREFEMQQDHCEYINLPEGFVHLGSSRITKNEVMKHSSKVIYGCQFHPEVSGELGQQFIQNFLSI